MISRTFRTISIALVTPALILGASLNVTTVAQDQGTPTTTYACGAQPPAPATPPMGDADMEMDMSMDVEFDQVYIDMMIPHHASIVALAQVALPELTDPRLLEMAQNIIDSQTVEMEELMLYRESWYGGAAPMTMDDHMMAMMMEAMPGMGTDMDMMGNQMSEDWQVSTFCAADDPDLAFIEQVIPHHEMAVMASEHALSMAVHPEIAEFAQRVITAQQTEIDLLNVIWAELSGEATPAT